MYMEALNLHNMQCVQIESRTQVNLLFFFYVWGYLTDCKYTKLIYIWWSMPLSELWNSQREKKRKEKKKILIAERERGELQELLRDPNGNNFPISSSSHGMVF